MKKPVILYRDADMPPAELDAIVHVGLDSTDSRTTLRKDDLVIGRYSVLPYYFELGQDLRLLGANLINSYSEHLYLADIGQWSVDLQGLTPMTWAQGTFRDLPSDRSFVLKGQTNSMKFLWDTHMFAADKNEVKAVLRRLLDDSLIGRQVIYAREYIPLISYGEGLHGLPISKEFRFFVLCGQIIGSGFYWSSHLEEVGHIPSPSEVPEAFLKAVLSRIGDLASFLVFDVAQAQTGDWLVVDVNDGQMSGLSEVQPMELYQNMRHVLEEHF